jgi:ABC-type multidrug transport system permease subunit
MYYHTLKSTSTSYSLGGIMLNVWLLYSVTSLTEIADSFLTRNISTKQQFSWMYPLFAEALQKIIIEFPTKFVPVTIC